MKRSKNLEYISTVGMPREEWIERRKRTIGGSDASAVVGLNPYASPYSLWAEKTGRVPGFEGNLATDVGTFLEEFIAQRFAAETGKKVRRLNAIIYNPAYPFAHVNIDRDIVNEEAGLECKSTSEMNLRKFKDTEFPEIYYCQCVHSMAITGAKRWYLAVLIGNKDFKIFTLERDQAEIDALMGAEATFMEGVKTNTPPPLDGLKATTDTLKTIYADSGNAVVDLFGHRADLARYLALNAQIKELETERDQLANNVKAFMGDAWGGECDGIKVTWKSQNGKPAFDKARFAADHPDIDLSAYYNATSTRPFRVSEIKS